MSSKIINFSFIAFGFFAIYLATILGVSTFSENKGEKVNTYFPSVQAQINFFQDKFWTKSYSSSWSSFWSSPEYYNQSFDSVKVTIWAEAAPVPGTIGETVTRISRNSH